MWLASNSWLWPASALRVEALVRPCLGALGRGMLALYICVQSCLASRCTTGGKEGSTHLCFLSRRLSCVFRTGTTDNAGKQPVTINWSDRHVQYQSIRAARWPLLQGALYSDPAGPEGILAPEVIATNGTLVSKDSKNIRQGMKHHTSTA